MAKTYAEHEDPELMARGQDREMDKQAAVEASERRVADDFHALVEVLGHIDQMFDRIRTFQNQLEERLRNMLRYKNRGRRDYGKRMDASLDRLLAAMAADPGIAEVPAVEGYIDASDRFFGEALHSSPRWERTPFEAAPVTVSPPDPVDLFRRDLKNAYLRRLRPTPAQVAAFIERNLGERTVVDASDLAVETIDDFLAFDALLVMSRRGRLPNELSSRFTIVEDVRNARVANDYVECEPFRIARARG